MSRVGKPQEISKYYDDSHRRQHIVWRSLLTASKHFAQSLSIYILFLTFCSLITLYSLSSSFSISFSLSPSPSPFKIFLLSFFTFAMFLFQFELFCFISLLFILFFQRIFSPVLFSEQFLLWFPYFLLYFIIHLLRFVIFLWHVHCVFSSLLNFFLFILLLFFFLSISPFFPLYFFHQNHLRIVSFYFFYHYSFTSFYHITSTGAPPTFALIFLHILLSTVRSKGVEPAEMTIF